MPVLRLEILRRRSAEDAPYLQCFDYEPRSGAETVATALTRLNETLPEPIRWECSCLQKKCGACAMVVDGRPALACDARLKGKKNTVRIEPLRKFPVVADLIVDRSALFEALRALRLWFEADAAKEETASETGYEASRCLQCGCCLEVCPNYAPGGVFAGMAAAVPAARLLAACSPAELTALSEAYNRRFYAGCGKSLACRNVCPAGIDVERLLVNSNAIAVWKRLLRRKRR